MKALFHSLLSFFLILTMLPCCTPDALSVSTEKDGEPADLSITVNIPTLPTTKTDPPGYWDGDETNLASWGNWEKLVDGRQLYNVTLLIIRLRDNRLVAYRDFYMKNTGLNDYCNNTGTYGLNGFWNESGSALYGDDITYTTAVKATFSHSHPKHGGIEALATGAYRMLVVANYRSVSGVDSSKGGTEDYGGLVDETNVLTTTIEGLLTNFNTQHQTDGIQDFDATNYPDIFNFQLHAAKEGDEEQYICKQQPQPLTLVKDFFLRSGSNEISDAKLVRSYSRIRIEITNESEVQDLKIQNLIFPEPFAQKQSSLFDFSEFGGASPFKPQYLGCPIINSPDAIIPFDPQATPIGKMVTTPNNKYNTEAVFDAYILESQRGDAGYKFNLEVFYDNDITPSHAILLSDEPILTTSVFNQWLNKGCDLYIVKLRGSFMYDNNSQNYGPVSSGSYSGTPPIQFDKPNNFPGSTGTNLASDKNKYIWHLIPESSNPNGYYIHNYLGANRYLGYMPGAAGQTNRWIPLVSEENKKLYVMDNLLDSNDNPVGLRFQGIGTDANKFLNRGNNDKWLKWTTNEFAEDEGSLFYLYPVRIGTTVNQITVQVIDEFTGQPHNLREIRRNDFITVHVSVIYHPDPYDLQFIVKPWADEKDEHFAFD